MKTILILLASILLLAGCSTTQFDVHHVEDSERGVQIYYSNDAAFTGKPTIADANTSFFLQFEKKGVRSMWYIVCDVTGLKVIEPPMELVIGLDDEIVTIESERLTIERDAKDAGVKIFFPINTDLYTKIVFADDATFRINADSLQQETALVKDDKVRFNLFRDFIENMVLQTSVIIK